MVGTTQPDPSDDRLLAESPRAVEQGATEGEHEKAIAAMFDALLSLRHDWCLQPSPDYFDPKLKPAQLAVDKVVALLRSQPATHTATVAARDAEVAALKAEVASQRDKLSFYETAHGYARTALRQCGYGVDDHESLQSAIRAFGQRCSADFNMMRERAEKAEKALTAAERQPAPSAAAWRAMEVELAMLREAVGLLTTLHPSMEIDVRDPLGMARKIVAHVTRPAEPDPWKPSGIDYDRSIHSNPSADAWARLFVATYPGLADRLDVMRGWFANAMMAMHDSIKQRPASPAAPSSELREASLDLLAPLRLSDGSYLFRDTLNDRVWFDTDKAFKLIAALAAQQAPQGEKVVTDAERALHADDCCIRGLNLQGKPRDDCDCGLWVMPKPAEAPRAATKDETDYDAMLITDRYLRGLDIAVAHNALVEAVRRLGERLAAKEGGA